MKNANQLINIITKLKYKTCAHWRSEGSWCPGARVENGAPGRPALMVAKGSPS